MVELLQALAKFQADQKPINKSADNPFFKSKYASLDEIQNQIKPNLQKQKLLIVQSNTVIDGTPYVQTRVYHADTGQYIESVFPVIVSKQSSQDYGSAVSYAKRYSITGLLNLIISDEDDDGNTASNNVNKSSFAPSNSFAGEKPALTNEKLDTMVKFITEGKVKEVESAMNKYTMNAKQTELLTNMINQSKSQSIIKSAKK